MIETSNKWEIINEWTLDSGHFKYHYVVSNHNLSIDQSQRQIKKQFLQHMNDTYGDPGSRWGFRFDRNFDMISIYFSQSEDAVIFSLTHG